MRRLLFAAPLVLLLGPAASAGDRDFAAVVQSVESNLGLHRTRIPLFGTVMFFVRVARPAGVKQLEMAIFEDANYSPPDAERFDALMRSAAGERWSPLVRVRSRRDDESTYIYVKPDGKEFKMIIATFERDEAVIMHLKAKPEALLDSLDEPEHAGKRLGGERGK
jgi:hypothetical protein